MIKREYGLRFLGIKLSWWPWFLVMSGMFLFPYALAPFAGFIWWHAVIIFGLYSLIAIPAVRMFYLKAREIGRPLNWDNLPLVLPGMVKAKFFTREQAIGVYDLFFYSADPRERVWDLRKFAPLPPKKIIPELES